MALNAYMRLTGETQGEIKGSVTESGLWDSIKVIAVTSSVSRRRFDVGTEGKVEYTPLTITKEVDKSTPQLMTALLNNEIINSLDLEFWTLSATGRPIQHYTIKLYVALITDIRFEMPNNQYPENEHHQIRERVSFIYQGITWTWMEGGIDANDGGKGYQSAIHYENYVRTFVNEHGELIIPTVE